MDHDAPHSLANAAPDAEQDYERLLRLRAGSLPLAALCLLLVLTWALSRWKSPDLILWGPGRTWLPALGLLVFLVLGLRTLYANVWTEFEDPEFRARNLRFYGLRLLALGLALVPCLFWGLPTMLHHLGGRSESTLSARVLEAGEDRSRGGCGRYLELLVDLDGRRRVWRACHVEDEAWEAARDAGRAQVRGRRSAHGFDVEEVGP